jgi:hypothetical protein
MSTPGIGKCAGQEVVAQTLLAIRSLRVTMWGVIPAGNGRIKGVFCGAALSGCSFTSRSGEMTIGDALKLLVNRPDGAPVALVWNKADGGQSACCLGTTKEVWEALRGSGSPHNEVRFELEIGDSGEKFVIVDVNEVGLVFPGPGDVEKWAELGFQREHILFHGVEFAHVAEGPLAVVRATVKTASRMAAD